MADPTISKDINLYFSGDLNIHNTPGGGNLVVTDDSTSEQALNSGFSPRDVYSAHRPHAAQHASETLSGNNEMSTSSLPQSPYRVPVAALAVPVSHVVVHDADIAIAEVYLGEVEEYKE